MFGPNIALLAEHRKVVAGACLSPDRFTRFKLGVQVYTTVTLMLVRHELVRNSSAMTTTCSPTLVARLRAAEPEVGAHCSASPLVSWPTVLG
jgi:hypothetical protein